MIMRKIIEWCDEKFEESLEELDDRKSMKKAALSGFVEGLGDGAIIMYVPLVIACFIYQAKLKDK